MFQARCKCTKHVYNIKNALLIFAPPCIPNALLIPEKIYLASISHRRRQSRLSFIKGDTVTALFPYETYHIRTRANDHKSELACQKMFGQLWFLSSEFHTRVLWALSICLWWLTTCPDIRICIHLFHCTKPQNDLWTLKGQRFPPPSTPVGQNWASFCSTGSGFWDMCRFSKLPCLGMKVGHWPKFQKLHLYSLSNPRVRNCAYFHSTCSGFRDTGRFSKLP